MHIYSDEGKLRSFQENMPPFPGKKTTGEDTPYEAACKTVKNNTVDKDKDDYSGKEYNYLELMENVTEFELIPCKLGGDKMTGEVKTPPYKLDIKLGITDSDGENTYYFRRSILLNYRGAR